MVRQLSFGLAALVFVSFLSCTAAVGQNTGTKPQSFANDYMIGSWTVEGTADGKAVKGTMRVRPAAKGVCLIYTWSLELSQDDAVRGLGVAARDPKTAEIVEYGFESDGTQFVQRYPAESFPDAGIGYGERIGTINGKPYKGKITVDRKGRQEFLFTVASEQGEDVRFTFQRVAREQVVSAAYEHLKDLEDLIGDWIAEDTLSQDMPGFAQKGEKVTYRATARWMQDKAIMQIQFTATTSAGNVSHESWFFGWDAANKKIVYSGFDTLGGRVWGTAKKEDANTWLWENNWIGSDGTQGSGKSKTTMLDNNKAHSHQFTDTVVDGKPQPDGKLVYKRMQ